MIRKELALSDLFLIVFPKHEDQRGYFTRAYCQVEFAKLGLALDFVQHNISFNRKKGTIRGMHFQSPPYEEDKIVRCISGRILDVVVDIRRNSVTYGQWLGVELSAENNQALYIPKGFAHGFQTLTDDASLYYLMSEFYQAEYARGICWNDEEIAIQWPIATQIISDKDKTLPNLKDL